MSFYTLRPDSNEKRVKFLLKGDRRFEVLKTLLSPVSLVIYRYLSNNKKISTEILNEKEKPKSYNWPQGSSHTHGLDEPQYIRRI